ncbi:ABC-type glycerol-3-phosphate transport system substrate-binding protein [Nocardioides aromaticivorans]|uniref:ABC-type glycerol-3-phosphate transport system substrate-binding protein n=1 Tax=Nocardioides aromaticivorans TaxID=200618 RepID=A0A7Y9ZIB3_9ACTN|nr:hypothetical protein [Nocardioides aromaticivorans]NYI46017.1 ABC-type glycerol-3-phosphate transport system substrate-binding protein [Nocardioides aromaticivorans]
MKKTTLGLGAIALAAALSLTACGTDEGKLAKEYCDLLKDATSAADSGDTAKAAEASKALTDWLEKNKDVKGDEDEFTDAVKDECGDIANLP